ncbi:MAG: ExeA family protein [Pseudomonadota bacterium]
MYENHFGLREPPFGLTPDTSYFFSCAPAQEALNTLLVATRSGEGFIKITGEVGTGKTLLCRNFLAALGHEFIAAYVPNPYLDPDALLQTLADDFRIERNPGTDRHHLLKLITHTLLDFARAGKRVIVCLDEAQAMPLQTLEALRLLTNLETEKRKLLQVVLFGQPELDQKLQDPCVRQLRQRISFQYRLRSFQAGETEDYLRHRLNVAGYARGELFTWPAARMIHGFAGGVPRLVNILAHKSLLLAFGRGDLRVRVADVYRAAADTPAAARGVLRRAIPVIAALAVSVGGVGWALLA